MKIFFIVGEDSGDALASGLMKQLKESYGKPIQFYGIGGPKMEAEGFETLMPQKELEAFGIWEIVPKIPTFLKIKDAIIKEIEKTNPDAVITVDFPEFNFLTAKGIKKRGVYKGKIIHYVAPTVWAWREGRAKKIAKFIDGIMCLFPMEVEYFTKQGIRASYVGHPIVEKYIATPKGKSYRDVNEIPKDVVILGLFFGSRESEFKNSGRILVEAAKLIIEAKKNVYVIVPTLAKNEYIVQKLLDNLSAPAYVTTSESNKWLAFEACDVAIAVSGTVGLELAYARVPHVITYKVSGITYFLLKILVKVKKAHLVNILMGRDIVPEFIQSEAEPERIAGSALTLLHDKEKRQEMLAGFEDFRNFLGANNTFSPSKKAAEFVLSMISGKRNISNEFNGAANRKPR